MAKKKAAKRRAEQEKEAGLLSESDVAEEASPHRPSAAQRLVRKLHLRAGNAFLQLGDLKNARFQTRSAFACLSMLRNIKSEKEQKVAADPACQRLFDLIDQEETRSHRSFGQRPGASQRKGFGGRVEIVDVTDDNPTALSRKANEIITSDKHDATASSDSASSTTGDEQSATDIADANLTDALTSSKRVPRPKRKPAAGLMAQSTSSLHKQFLEARRNTWKKKKKGELAFAN